MVTGDDSGNLGCYEFKKGEPQVIVLKISVTSFTL